MRETDTPRADAHAWTETNAANAIVSARFARILERELSIALAALSEIAKYGKDHAGCCPYGCDTPTIATNALNKLKP